MTQSPTRTSAAPSTSLEGTYFESNISVTKAVTITGQSKAGVIVGPSIIDGHLDNRFTNASNGFIIRSSDVTIQTLTIDGNQDNGLTGTENFRTAVITDHTLGNFDNTVLDDLAIKNVYRRGVDTAPHERPHHGQRDHR